LQYLAIIFDNLVASELGKRLDKPLHQRVLRIYQQIGTFYPSLLTMPNQQKQIEKDTNKIFFRFFKYKKSLDQMVEEMKQHKSSDNRREKEIFACIVYHMIDEYRHFHEFQAEHLVLFGKLYGRIILDNIVEGKSHEIMLRIVEEATLKQTNKSIIAFGCSAIEVIKNSIPKWPRIAYNLLGSSRFQQLKPELYLEIKGIVKVSGVQKPETD